MLRFLLSAPIWLGLSLAWAHEITPLYFERNTGQTAANVRYLARTRQATIFVTDQETVFGLRGVGKDEDSVHMSLPGAGANSAWREEDAQKLTISSYVGTKDRWRDEIPTFRKLRRPAIYPGIDLIYYGNSQQMEYDFVLAPGADPKPIRLRFSGGKLSISPEGDLTIATRAGTLIHRRPRIYQERQEIAGRFRLRAPDEVGIELTGTYDRTRPLVIDPVVNFSSFYGGEGDDRITAAYGSAVAGYTNSIAFPGANVAAMGGYDAFYMSFGSVPRIVYIGGSGDDRAWAVWTSEYERDTGSFAIAGESESRDFPTFYSGRTVFDNGQSTAGFAGGTSDGFLVYVDTSRDINGNQNLKLYSTLLGGAGRDRALAVAGTGNSIVVGGETDSPDLAATGFQSQYGGGKDGFAAQYTFSNFGGNVRGPLTYWGGAGDDAVRAVAYSFARTVLAGTTTSDNLPALRALQSERRGGVDGYVTASTGLFPQSQQIYLLLLGRQR